MLQLKTPLAVTKRCHRLQLKILCSAMKTLCTVTKTLHSQINELIKKKQKLVRRICIYSSQAGGPWNCHLVDPALTQHGGIFVTWSPNCGLWISRWRVMVFSVFPCCHLSAVLLNDGPWLPFSLIALPVMVYEVVP